MKGLCLPSGVPLRRSSPEISSARTVLMEPLECIQSPHWGIEPCVSLGGETAVTLSGIAPRHAWRLGTLWRTTAVFVTREAKGVGWSDGWRRHLGMS